MFKSWATSLFSVWVAVTLLAGVGTRPAWCAGPDWVLLDENADSRFYFDQGGDNNQKDGAIQVRTRVVYTDEGKADALKILESEKAKQFEKLAETRYIHLLDCKTEQSRLLEARHLDSQGVTLKNTDLSTSTEWEDVPPYARMGLVLDKVCGQAPPAKP